MPERQTRTVQNRHERKLNEILKLPGNDKCADCNAKNPRWASYSLGVFLCIRCASLHRKMGTHISKVKSLSMDTWSIEQIEYLRQMGGNQQVNSNINPCPEKHPLPLTTDDDEFQLEYYIRQKWEKRMFEQAGQQQQQQMEQMDHHSEQQQQQMNHHSEQQQQRKFSLPSNQSYDTLPSLRSVSSSNTSVNEFAGQFHHENNNNNHNYNPFFSDSTFVQSPSPNNNNPFFTTSPISTTPSSSSTKNPFFTNHTNDSLFSSSSNNPFSSPSFTAPPTTSTPSSPFIHSDPSTWWNTSSMK